MIIAYISGNSRPISALCKAAKVKVQFRNPDFACVPERHAKQVYAPQHPAIVAAYKSLGIPSIDRLPIAGHEPRDVGPLADIETLLICAAGPHLFDALDYYQRTGTRLDQIKILAINTAASLVGADYWLCLDGHQEYGAGPIIGDPVWLIPDQAKIAPAGAFARLSDMMLAKATTAPFTSMVALRLALALRPARVLLAGLDMIPGAGADGLTVARDASRFNSERPYVLALIDEMRAAGIEVEHYAPGLETVDDEATAPADDESAADDDAAPALPGADYDLTEIKGLGPKTKAQIAPLGVETVRDLAYMLDETADEIEALKGVSAADVADWRAQALAMVGG